MTKEDIQNGFDLDDTVINAALKLLKKQFPAIDGLQSTLLGQNLSFDALKAPTHAVQILNTGICSICY